MTIDIVPSWVIGDLDLTSHPYSVAADGSVSVGEPEMIVEGVAGSLSDGDLERVVRHGNRVYVLPVYVEGASHWDLAQAEADLRNAVNKPMVPLVHDPGDGLTPASVYDVLTAQLTPERDDSHESHLIRKFTLTLTCLPFAHSVDEMSVESPPAPAGATVRQVTLNVDTGGTERTPVDLHVYSATDRADMLVGVVHTSPDDGSGYSPQLSPHRVVGNGSRTPAPADTLSGFVEPLSPQSVTCEIPNGMLPAGGYEFAIRLQASTTTPVMIEWAAHTFFTQDWFGYQEEGVIQDSTAWTPVAPSEWEIVGLATLTLPTVRGVDGTTRISFRCLTPGTLVNWDEAFLFRSGDDCATTILHHPPDHIWIDAADAQSPVSRPSVGYSADGSDARHPGLGLLADATHVLRPEGSIVYAAGVTNDLRIKAKWRRGWHSNAAS